jgi:general secretion pathway protein D
LNLKYRVCSLILPCVFLCASRAAGQDTNAVRVTRAGIVVDFQDVDLRAVIAALSEAGGLNVAYNDLPARRVTLRLHDPVARGDMLSLLKSVAQSNGLQVIEDGKVIRLQADDARASNAPRAGDATGGAKAADARLYVYRLKHVRAAKLASTLQSIFGGRGAGPSVAAGLTTRSLSQQLTANQLPPTSVDTSRAGVVVALTPAPGATANLPAALQGEVQIVPDETTNSLVIRAQAGDYDVVRQAIEALDLRPLQVLIEVLIAEVRHNSELDVGVKATSRREPAGTASTGSSVIDNSSTADLIIRLSRSARFDLNIAISALQTRGDVRILSRPVLLAQNNQETKILVGSQRPFVQASRSLPTDAGVRDQVVEYKDVGTSLTILPTINADGYVNLQVAQEVSTATTEIQFGAPVISTREASTHLFVRDGQTAVLGGLIDREHEDTRTGLPLLMDLPLIGRLFGSTTLTTTNSELFLFLTPHIVQTDDDADRVRQEMEARSPTVTRELPKNPPLSPKPPFR